MYKRDQRPITTGDVINSAIFTLVCAIVAILVGGLIVHHQLTFEYGTLIADHMRFSWQLVPLGILCGFGTFIFMVVVNLIAGGASSRRIEIDGYTSALVIASSVGFAEELLFRGLFQGWWGIGAASLLFGLAHFDRRNPGKIMLAFWAGVFLGWLYIMSDTLWLPIIAHATNNSIVFMVIAHRRASTYRRLIG